MTNTTDTWKQNADRAMELFERKSPEQLAVELVQMQDKHTQAMAALDRMQDQRDQLAAQHKDATRQCWVMAELLRDSQRYVRYHLEHHECDARIVMGLISDIDTAMTGKLPAPPSNITETIRTAPERIWLQVGDQSEDGSYQFPEHHDGVTWCADSVVACEVPYVRADLVGYAAPTAQSESDEASANIA